MGPLELDYTFNLVMGENSPFKLCRVIMYSDSISHCFACERVGGDNAFRSGHS